MEALPFAEDPLALPAFLKAEKKKSGGVRLFRRRKKNKPPEGWEDAERWQLFLMGDLSEKIGSGFRNVWVQVGYKWVKMAYNVKKAAGVDGEVVDGFYKAKIPLSEWKSLSKESRSKKLN